MTAIAEHGSNTPGPVTLTEWHHAEQPTDGSRLECLEGYWFVSPAPGSPHQFAGDELRELLKWGIKAAGQAGELVALTGIGTDLSTRRRTGLIPDVVVCERAQAGQIIPASALLLAVEVWSPGNAPWERHLKRQAYAQAKIPHFWELTFDGGRAVELIIHQHRRDGFEVVHTVTPETGPVTLDEPFPVTIDFADLQL